MRSCIGEGRTAEGMVEITVVDGEVGACESDDGHSTDENEFVLEREGELPTVFKLFVLE